MEDRYRELLASTLLFLAEKMKKDYESDKFRGIMIDDIGLCEDEIDDIIELMNDL